MARRAVKTTLAHKCDAPRCRRRAASPAIIDAEHAFDRFYAEHLGVDTENL